MRSARSTIAYVALVNALVVTTSLSPGRAQGPSLSDEDRGALATLGTRLPEHGLGPLSPPPADAGPQGWEDYAKRLVEVLMSSKAAKHFDTSARPLGRAVRALIPSHPRYKRLQGYLRKLTLALASDRPVLPKVRYKVAAGTVSPEVAVLRRRLRLEGYGGDKPPPARPKYFDRALRLALNAWQRDNGLGQTRHVDNLTRWRLNRLDELLGRVALNLRRWRQHTVGDGLAQHIMVDINRGWLSAWRGGNEELRFAVIAGKSSDIDATPSLSSRIDRIVVNPAWRVPARIAEVFKRDAGHDVQRLQERGFKVRVDGTRWHLTQPPGPSNPLGHFIFRMPKTRGIFLHDTNRKHLFKGPKRHLSHGCVRLEHALELARWALPKADHATLSRLIANGQTKHYVLDEPIATHLVYVTMDVDPTGRMVRLPDPYRRDASELLDSLGEVPAILAYRWPDTPPPSPPSSASRPGASDPSTTVSGPPALRRSDPAQDPRGVPRYALDASVRPVQGGESWPLERFRGRIVVLTFLASWCANCHKLAPSLKRVVNGLRARGVDVGLLGIGLDEPGPLKAYVERWKLPYPVVVAGPRLRNGATSLGRIDRLPTTWVVGRSGVPLYSYEGRDSAKALANDLERYLQAERALAK